MMKTQRNSIKFPQLQGIKIAISILNYKILLFTVYMFSYLSVKFQLKSMGVLPDQRPQGP